MKTIVLRPRKATPAVLARLEKKNLIRTFAPTKRALSLKRGKDGAVDTLYTSAPRYGSHKLICVGKNATTIELTTHPDNEEIILINTSQRAFKPLYLIVGLHKQDALERKARSGSLRARDLMALELAYNTAASVFTMLKGTPHCEVTAPGKGQHPVFFVTEPADFEMSRLDLSGYDIVLK